ncbi:MAG: hypothetical protein NVV74_24745 [Magnetospirillum sp.]|nr:hypothetical protein [Magnetospirillum sp.]
MENPQAARQWQELAHMLRDEWQGQGIDCRRALELADGLLPDYPELKHTLTHIRRRMTRRRG